MFTLFNIWRRTQPLTCCSRDVYVVGVVTIVCLLLLIDDRVAFSQGVIGSITRSGFNPTALALDETRNRLYVFDKGTSHVFFFDATTLEELDSVETTIGESLSMVVDESKGKLYVARFGSGAGDNIAVIDIATGLLPHYLQTSGFTNLVNDETLDV